MKALLSTSLLVIVLLASASPASAQVRYFEQNGVTYRETREVVRRPVYETTWQDRTCVTYRPGEPQTRRYYRTERVPITEYRTVPRWVGRYNPFVQPYLVYDQVPVVRYEQRTVAVDMQVAPGRPIAVTGTQKVPVVTQRIVEEEVLRRVAVARPATPTNLAMQPAPGVAAAPPAGRPADPFARPTITSTPMTSAPVASVPVTSVPFSSAPQTARSTPVYGGVGQLESDPPRDGTGWRPVRR